MNPQLRLTRSLFRDMQDDLRRPHPFAGERAGFVYARLANGGSDWPLVLITGYMPLADERYVPDASVGARIDSESIRTAMQGVLNRDEGCFHVHIHEWPGRPSFGRTDQLELPRVAQSFRNVGPKHAHGLLLLSPDSASAEVWMPGRAKALPGRVNIVGFPMSIIEASS